MHGVVETVSVVPPHHLEVEAQRVLCVVDVDTAVWGAGDFLAERGASGSKGFRVCPVILDALRAGVALVYMVWCNGGVWGGFRGYGSWLVRYASGVSMLREGGLGGGRLNWSDLMFGSTR